MKTENLQKIYLLGCRRYPCLFAIFFFFVWCVIYLQFLPPLVVSYWFLLLFPILSVHVFHKRSRFKASV
ncbi:hypothetical protein Cadr_000029064 [Camelus dromedarius]|uniref:Uncharacterized protein n=1 Tax=Camelus dromedarius TaxID=9838 RepID=A0A5N4C6G9_CAMDR|nr:hypothetical protein Cadr_000029064 [Camelus dromedarius]